MRKLNKRRETMKVMVCDCTPYLDALEGLRHVLRESRRDIVPGEIDIIGLEPVYDEDSLERKVRRMNSGRRFLSHVRKLARIVGVRIDILAWNQFLLRNVNGNKILVGQLGEWQPIVVAFEGPAEDKFIGIMQSRHPDFEDIDAFPFHSNDFFAERERETIGVVRKLMTN